MDDAQDLKAGPSTEAVRPQLFSIAYRMLGGAGDAENIVQDAYVRLHRAVAAGTEVRNPAAFLTTTVTRLAIDFLRSARVKRETYVGTWLPEPVLAGPGPDDRAELADSLALSFLVLLETLNPLERAVFLLREVFGYPYDEIAGIVEKTEANCRQVFSRARRRIDEGRTRFTSSAAERDELAARFRGAAERGSVDELIALLATDAAFYGDGGGKARAVATPIFGGERVGRVVGGFFTRFASIGATFRPATVNGQPGLISLDAEGRLINVFAFDIADGRIQTIRSVINPDKLEHLGLPLSDVAHIH